MQEKMKPDRAQAPLLLKIISPTNTTGITDRALEMGQGQGAKLLGKSRKLRNSPFRLIKYGFSFKSSLEDLIGPQIQCLFLSHSLSHSLPHAPTFNIHEQTWPILLSVHGIPRAEFKITTVIVFSKESGTVKTSILFP